MSDPSGRVVAELGRPETPEETAERKARDRVLRRSRQNWRNLVGSLVACVLLVAAIVLIVPRGDQPVQRDVDVQQVAQQYGDTAGRPLIAPAVPAGWKANAAELRGSGDGSSWYVGWVIDGAEYAGLTEGLPGTDDLLATTMQRARPTGTTTIGGLPWRVYDRRELGRDAGNVAYGLATRIGGVLVAVYGTAPEREIRDLAAKAAASAEARGLEGGGTLP
ncbi:DUF4245 domain-containing protein [Amnibacterium setariae]|uniref:DUF4245 domain-containing protein n=1 Tax=Amnibacterium setariae TaxID=2306585 RepID=UPI001314366B|nr:DUF4245 domain-containing protein [Amnibacterium setariae]